jgi:hypothetical protein
MPEDIIVGLRLFWLAAFATLGAAQPIALLPGAQGSAASIPFFSASSLAPLPSADGVPGGAFQLLPKPDGSKFYLLTNSGITVLDRNLNSPVQILKSLNAVPTTLALSPDGRRLFVIAANSAYFVDTTVDTILGAAVNLPGTPLDVAFSHDSQTAFILSNVNGAFTTFVTPVDLAANTVGTSLTLPVSGNATGIATGPNGLLYVSAPYALFEIDPRTLLVTPAPNAVNAATISLNGTPGKLQFTSSSQYAVALNCTPANGAAIFFDLIRYTATTASAANVDGVLDQLVVASDSRIFAHSNQNTLYELSLDGYISLSPVLSALPRGSQVLSILPSSEAQAKSLFLTTLAGNTYTLNRIDLSANRLAAQVPVPQQDGQLLAFAGTNPTTGGLIVQGIGTYQTLASGAISQPLVARLLDANGVPVFNAPVTFTVLCGGVTLTNTHPTTNSSGFVEVYAIAGAASGSYQIQATVPGGVGGGAAFTIYVAGPGPALSGCSQYYDPSGLFIVSGNGQLVPEQHVAQQLLLVMAKDAAGNPLPNQLVQFSVIQGDGTILCPGVGEQFPYLPSGTCTPSNGNLILVTDATGRAGVKFLATSILGESFAQAVVNAVSSTGSVNFFVTTVLVARSNGSLASLPIAYILSPQPEAVQGFTGVRVIRGRTGETIAGGLQIQVVPVDGSKAGQPIPNVAVDVSGQGDPETTPSASCAGGIALTDANGLASCDIVVGPVAGTAVLNVIVGGAIQTPLVAIVATPGGPPGIFILQGDNQSGGPGQQLTLRARIVDAAGHTSSNVPVSWTVAQGSGTLSGITRQSDAVGNVQSTLTLGSSPGTVVVRLTAGSGSTVASATFAVNINTP